MTNILIPVKSLAQAKQRLSGVLSDEARAGLVLAMLKDMLSTLGSWNDGDVWIVSADTKVIATAHDFGARVIREEHSSGYNEAVSTGFRELDPKEPVLVLPGDLPRLTFEDLGNLLSSFSLEKKEVRIIPDQKRIGTNALFLSSPGLIEPAFGSDSFSKHKAAAKTVEADTSIYELANLAHDIDSPDDLFDFASLNTAGETSKYLGRVGFCREGFTEQNGKVA